jgi:hypothetical protein
MHIQSFGDNQYYVSFKDNHSITKCCIFLNIKTKYLRPLKSWNNLFSNISSHSKKLHTNWIEEFTNKDFEYYLENEGILHKTTTTYCWKENGVVEQDT